MNAFSRSGLSTISLPISSGDLPYTIISSSSSNLSFDDFQESFIRLSSFEWELDEWDTSLFFVVVIGELVENITMAIHSMKNAIRYIYLKLWLKRRISASIDQIGAVRLDIFIKVAPDLLIKNGIMVYIRKFVNANPAK